MDEYVNYLVKNLGKSTTSKGINGYTLGNEPDLWHHTHPRIQTTPLKAAELIKKSVALSKVVKSIDSKAEISLENADESNASSENNGNSFWWAIAIFGGTILCIVLGLFLFRKFKK